MSHLNADENLKKVLEQARMVLDIEAQAILELKNRLNSDFSKAVELLVKCKGKAILTGIGKSGHIARKIASTLTSTGTPSVFLHPSESSHGDLGLISQEDIVIAISYGGASHELNDIIRYCVRKNIPLIAMTGNMKSPLAQSSSVTLDIHIKEEACPLNLAPTASSTVTLALGDALAMAALIQRGFKSEHFAEFHPGGSLGFRLLTKVKDLMYTGNALPIVQPQTPIKEVFKIMTHKEVRGTAVVVENNSLKGVITDGDIRRYLEKDLSLNETADKVMNRSPKVIDLNELAEKALQQMEENKVGALVVLDKSSPQPNSPVGLVALQDLLKKKFK